MKAFIGTILTITFVNFFLLCFLTTPTRCTVVLMDNHEPVFFDLNPEGILASADLNHPVDLPSALVLGPDPAICFFWRSQDNSVRPSSSSSSSSKEKNDLTAEWVSIRFTDRKPIVQRFPGAERLFCYDASRENANYNVFTLFMESATGETQLIRLQGSENEAFVALDLSNYCADNCVNARFALLNVARIRPKRARRPRFFLDIDYLADEDEEEEDDDKDNEDDVNFSVCYLMSKDRRSNPFEFSVTLSNLIDAAPQKSMFKSERPLPRTDRIVCFKNYRATPAKQRYIEEFLV